MKSGDTFKDMDIYLACRIEHLTLEKQKVPFTQRDKTLIHPIVKKLEAKITELKHTRDVLNGDIKSHSKYEWSKKEYLKGQKIEHLKKVTNQEA